MADKTTVKTATVKYVAVANCTYQNRWVARGTVIELPAGQTFVHSCFKVLNDETAHLVNTPTGFYDPTQASISAKRVNDVMAGVIRK